ncbi:glycosyltransferase family 4 protein [Acetobacter sp.]|uniref:glycosyltransferase family 4 protein n=1 Tax=Acetobacter sp. TaxID=440 RepID=UPI0025C1532B|nr:glycosyltransferase family 4 protein [Acetobacter sp.]MCH4091824.1 glycosyltransferase family 4 protein [Acetobacter sp.]MCI1300320.1 glycosyltransferase family 4 protein [Acetobacter sp.]MCI1316862.1 glycosyltransferase family 4 protein [Acetobacter sp.]
MKFLFVHQNFPGQFLHIVRHLIRSEAHEVVFISESNENIISGVRRVIYRKPVAPPEATHPGAREFALALSRADAVAQAASTLKDLGFVPDIIIGHHGWGELLNLQDIFPASPILGYFEFFYHSDGFDVGFDPEFPTVPDMLPRIRAKNAVNLVALNNPGWGQTPTLFQRSTYPSWALDKISVLREGVDLELCSPDSKAARHTLHIKDVTISPKDRLVTYVARDLEPYRGFHVFMRSLPRILKECPKARIVMVGGDGVSYGARLAHTTWRQYMLSELQGQIDLDRVHFVGKVTYDEFRALLKRSDAHVYLTYPFVASWSLREAMAMGCAIVGSDTDPVREFIESGRTGLLAPFLEPRKIADAVLTLLDNSKQAKILREGARAQAEATLCLNDYLMRYEDLIEQVSGLSPSADAAPSPRKRGSRKPTQQSAAASRKSRPAPVTAKTTSTAKTRSKALLPT